MARTRGTQITIADTLRDIAEESSLGHHEKVSLKQIAKKVDQLLRRVKIKTR